MLDIDPDQEFSLYPTGVCALNKADIFEVYNGNRIMDCNIVKEKYSTPEEFAEHIDEFVLLKMVDGGPTLTKYVVTRDNVVAYMRSVIGILRGLEKMHAAEYYHFDTKGDNVVVGVGPKMRLIDFGISRKATNLVAEETFSLSQNYFIYPYEARLLNRSGYVGYLNTLKKANGEGSAADLAHDILVTDADKFLNDGIKTYLSYLIPGDAYARANAYTFSDWFDEVYRTYGGYGLEFVKAIAPKVDVYSTGILLSKICYIVFRHVRRYINGESKTIKMDGSEFDIHVSEGLFRLIYKMLEVNPTKRISMKEVADEYEEWLRGFSVAVSPIESGRKRERVQGNNSSLSNGNGAANNSETRRKRKRT